MIEPAHTVCPHCSSVNRIPADRPASEAECGIPTLIAFEKGKVASQQAGLVDLEFLRRLVR